MRARGRSLLLSAFLSAPHLSSHPTSLPSSRRASLKDFLKSPLSPIVASTLIKCRPHPSTHTAFVQVVSVFAFAKVGGQFSVLGSPDLSLALGNRPLLTFIWLPGLFLPWFSRNSFTGPCSIPGGFCITSTSLIAGISQGSLFSPLLLPICSRSRDDLLVQASRRPVVISPSDTFVTAC